MVENLFANIPATLTEELFETLLARPGLRIERIVSVGQSSPEGFWYDQDCHEWILLLQGAARLEIEGRQPLELKPGSHVNIAAHIPHRVLWTDPDQATIWLAVYYE